MEFVKLGWLFRAVGTIGAVGVTVIDKGITYFNFLFKFFYYSMLIAYRRRCANIQCTVCTVFRFSFSRCLILFYMIQMYLFEEFIFSITILFQTILRLIL